MQRKEILSVTDLRLVVDSIFTVGNPTAYETFSHYDSDTLSFSDADKLCEHLAVPRPRRDSVLGFSIYYPDTYGLVEKTRINLDQKRCEGHTFRYQMHGWGLIQFQVDARDANNIACRVAVNSQKRANLWFDTYPELGSPDLWDWKTVEKHARRIIRTLRKYAQQIVGREAR
jgi:hypothetical protein